VSTVLNAAVAEWIAREVIRTSRATFGPHHAPIWGKQCRRCPPAICTSCSISRRDPRWDYHDQCTGWAWADYAESHIWWPDRDRIDEPHQWTDGPWQLWLKPRPCECGCDPAAHRTEPPPRRPLATQLNLFALT
jgi:hypothetical protein